MINLRYHVVSLVAVFLALAIGIAVGASVINQGLVQQQQDQLATIERNLDAKNDTISQLRRKVNAEQSYTELAEPRLLAGHLANSQVVFVVADGVEQSVVDALSQRVVQAGAAMVGEVWLNEGVGVQREADQRLVDRALGISTGSSATARYLLLQSLRAALRKTAPANVLNALDDGGLVTLRNQRVDSSPVPADTRIVVVSGAGAKPSLDAVMSPLVTLLAADDPNRVVVVEIPAPPSTDTTKDAKAAPTLVELVRAAKDLDGRVSTIDNVRVVSGRVATVLALEDLATGLVGDYGSGPGVLGLVPVTDR